MKSKLKKYLAFVLVLCFLGSSLVSVYGNDQAIESPEEESVSENIGELSDADFDEEISSEQLETEHEENVNIVSEDVLAADNLDKNSESESTAEPQESETTEDFSELTEEGFFEEEITRLKVILKIMKTQHY